MGKQILVKPSWTDKKNSRRNEWSSPIDDKNNQRDHHHHRPEDRHFPPRTHNRHSNQSARNPFNDSKEKGVFPIL